MTAKFRPFFFFACFALAVPLGCKDEQQDEPKEVKVLEAASNGSPVSVEFVKFSGEGADRSMEALLYNTGDKTAVAYVFVFRFYDASDKLLKIKPGTPFEDDTGFWSMSGARYKCEPKQNATLELGVPDIPAEAVRAELLASEVRAVAADGVTIEDWWMQAGSFSDWPKG